MLSEAEAITIIGALQYLLMKDGKPIAIMQRKRLEHLKKQLDGRIVRDMSDEQLVDEVAKDVKQ